MSGILRDDRPSEAADADDDVDDDGDDDDDDDESASDAAKRADVVWGENLWRSLRKLLLTNDDLEPSILPRVVSFGAFAVAVTAAVVLAFLHPLPFPESAWCSPLRSSRTPSSGSADGCMENDPQRRETRVNSCGGDVLACRRESRTTARRSLEGAGTRMGVYENGDNLMYCNSTNIAKCCGILVGRVVLDVMYLLSL